MHTYFDYTEYSWLVSGREAPLLVSPLWLPSGREMHNTTSAQSLALLLESLTNLPSWCNKGAASGKSGFYAKLHPIWFNQRIGMLLQSMIRRMVYLSSRVFHPLTWRWPKVPVVQLANGFRFRICFSKEPTPSRALQQQASPLAQRPDLWIFGDQQKNTLQRRFGGSAVTRRQTGIMGLVARWLSEMTTLYLPTRLPLPRFTWPRVRSWFCPTTSNRPPPFSNKNLLW